MTTPNVESEIHELREILAGILENPFGCPMCDSGKLRTPKVNHWSDCYFYRAEQALARIKEDTR